MTRFFLFFCTIIVISACSESDFPEKIVKDKLPAYIDFPYKKVIAVAGPEVFIVNPETMQLEYPDSISIVLDSSQIIFLNDVLSGAYNAPSRNGRESSSDCWMPRHGILFLNEKDSLVQYVFVCFECDQLRASKPTTGTLVAYKTFFDHIGLPAFEDTEEHHNFYTVLKSERVNNK